MRRGLLINFYKEKEREKKGRSHTSYPLSPRDFFYSIYFSLFLCLLNLLGNQFQHREGDIVIRKTKMCVYVLLQISITFALSPSLFFFPSLCTPEPLQMCV